MLEYFNDSHGLLTYSFYQVLNWLFVGCFPSTCLCPCLEGNTSVVDLFKMFHFYVVNNWIDVGAGTSLTVSPRCNSINHARYSLFGPTKKEKKHTLTCRNIDW